MVPYKESYIYLSINLLTELLFYYFLLVPLPVTTPTPAPTTPGMWYQLPSRQLITLLSTRWTTLSSFFSILNYGWLFLCNFLKLINKNVSLKIVEFRPLSQRQSGKLIEPFHPPSFNIFTKIFLDLLLSEYIAAHYFLSK